MANVTPHADWERFDHTPPPAASIYWQEAMYLHFAVPYTDAGSEIVGGFVYAHRRPLLDGGQVFCTSALYWRDGGVWYHVSVQPTVFDEENIFRVAHPFSQVRIQSSNHSYRHAPACHPYLTNLSWGSRHTVSMDLTFTSTREPFFFETLEKMGFIHYEQLGQVAGSLTVDGRKVLIPGAHGARDHTWGTRQWTVLKDHWLVLADLPDRMIHLLCTQTSQAKLIEGIIRLDQTGGIQRVVDAVAHKENPQHIVTPAQLTVKTDQGETHTLNLQRPVAFVMPVSPRESLVNANAEMVVEITWEGNGQRVQGIGYAEHLQTVSTPPGLKEWPFPIMGDESFEGKF
jgi:hypothetical protein